MTGIAAPLIAAETLETERLILRRPRLEDFEGMADYLRSDRVRYIGGPQPRRRAFDRLANFAGHWLLRGFGRYVAEDRATGRPVGHFGAFLHDDRLPPEMAWSIWHAEFEGLGLAREATAATLAHYRDDLGWPEVCARIHRDNAASLSVARHFGATPDIARDEDDTTFWIIPLIRRQEGAA